MDSQLLFVQETVSDKDDAKQWGKHSAIVVLFRFSLCLSTAVAMVRKAGWFDPGACDIHK